MLVPSRFSFSCLFIWKCISLFTGQPSEVSWRLRDITCWRWFDSIQLAFISASCFSQRAWSPITALQYQAADLAKLQSANERAFFSRLKSASSTREERKKREKTLMQSKRGAFNYLHSHKCYRCNHLDDWFHRSTLHVCHLTHHSG